MKNLTESLCSTLAGLPREQALAQGSRLVGQVWSYFPQAGSRCPARPNVAAPGALVATAFPRRKLPLEMAAFTNAFQFAEHYAVKGSEWCCMAVPVFSATALAEGRGDNCEALSYAVGLGMEAYSRLRESLGSFTDQKNIDRNLLAATLAAIVACGSIDRLPPQKLAQALGLGSSAITAVPSGYLPLQAATAARDGIAMVKLICAGFVGPPDPLACRWGVFEVFADARCAHSLDLSLHSTRARDDLERMLGQRSSGDDDLRKADGAQPVATFLAGLGLN